MLEEQIESKKEKRKVNGKVNTNQNKNTSDILENLSLKLTTIEEQNVKRVNELENINQDLTTQNLKLKERITNFNKSEWKDKFTNKLHNNFVNLNVTDTSKCINKILHVENLENVNVDKLENLENLEIFKCYQCEFTSKTLNILMNHKRKKHIARTKCRNIEKCKYYENCWFSHETDDSISTKTYFIT